jgi:hypothetical protein
MHPFEALRHEGVWGSVFIDNVILTSALVGDEWSASRLCLFNPGGAPGTHWIGGWVGPTAGLDSVEES